MSYEHVRVPRTAQLSLDDVVDRLRIRDAVVAVVLVGSTGTGSLRPWSDLDFLLVVNEAPKSHLVEVSIVDGRLSDILVATKAWMDDQIAAAPTMVEGDAWDWFRWFAAGKIVVDTGGWARAAQMRLTDKLETRPTMSEDERRGLRWWITYDVRVNRAYAGSGDALYLRALSIRLLHSYSRVIQGWFSARDLPWDGEKKAVRRWVDDDPEFLELLDKWSVSADVRERSELQALAADRALAPLGGLWPDGVVDVGWEVWESLTAGSP